MVKTAIYKELLFEIAAKEQEVSIEYGDTIRQSAEMIELLHSKLNLLRDRMATTSTQALHEDIEFFRYVKPQVLGKLFFYNEVYRIETMCPVSGGKMYRKYFASQLKLLKKNNRAYFDTDFHRYYRSGRTDRDEEYFVRGRLNRINGVDNFYFETDPKFSTYYDHILARLMAQDLLYAFLLARIDPETSGNTDLPEDLCWTGTKNALIELIYALYISGVISNGKIGVRKITLIFQSIFKTPLGDIHHAFHRMKERAGKRTLFIDQLKDSLEQYMDKSL